jgi:hypothetical protein
MEMPVRVPIVIKIENERIVVCGDLANPLTMPLNATYALFLQQNQGV